MRTLRAVRLALPLLIACALEGRGDLDQDQLALLKNAAGWELISMSDQDGGLQTEHTCFDAKPHPETCKGNLAFHDDGTFAENVYIHHQQLSRQGKYELSGDQISFYDEFGTRDGPYSVELNAEHKTLVLQMPQVRMELESEDEYHRKQSGKGTPQQGSLKQKVNREPR